MEKLKKIKIVLSIIYFLIVLIFLWSFFTTFSLDEISSYEFIRKNRDFLVGFRESNLLLITLGFKIGIYPCLCLKQKSYFTFNSLIVLEDPYTFNFFLYFQKKGLNSNNPRV